MAYTRPRPTTVAAGVGGVCAPLPGPPSGVCMDGAGHVHGARTTPCRCCLAVGMHATSNSSNSRQQCARLHGYRTTQGVDWAFDMACPRGTGFDWLPQRSSTTPSPVRPAPCSFPCRPLCPRLGMACTCSLRPCFAPHAHFGLSWRVHVLCVGVVQATLVVV